MISIISGFRAHLKEPSFMTLDPTIGQRDHLYNHQGLDILAVPFNQMMDQQIASLSLVDVQGVGAINAKGVLIVVKSLISKSINGLKGHVFQSDSVILQFPQSTKGLY